MTKLRLIDKFGGTVETVGKRSVTMTLSNRGCRFATSVPSRRLPKGTKVGDRFLVKVLCKGEWVAAVFEKARLNLSKKQWEKYLKKTSLRRARP